MYYIIVLVLLFVAELFYFKIADKFNIIDKPNERSSHSRITLRGGGIIFYFGALAYFLSNHWDNNLQGALVYGIGNSTEAIYYLDSGWTEALITPDEFAAGYKSVVGLVDMLRGSRKYSVEEKPVSYQLLTRKNLFDEENKKLLYAISQ